METMRGLYASWLVALPIGVIFFVLSQPIIRIMFERGAFGPEATKITADMLAFFSLGIPAMTAWQIATRAFYALQDTITPLKVGFIQIGIDIALLLTLPRMMGYRGLPLATVISLTMCFFLLWKLLCSKLPEIKEEKVLPTFAKEIVMCLVEGLPLYFVYIFLWRESKYSLFVELDLLFAVSILGFLFYFLTAYFLKYPGMGEILNKMKSLRCHSQKGERSNDETRNTCEN
jgi:putative peptidoglycan lipid II flippase